MRLGQIETGAWGAGVAGLGAGPGAAGFEEFDEVQDLALHVGGEALGVKADLL